MLNRNIRFLVIFVNMICGFNPLFSQRWHWVQDDLMFNQDGFSCKDVSSIAFTDYNHDGFPDIFIRRNGKSEIEFYEGNSSNAIPRWIYKPDFVNLTIKSRGIVTVDIDSNGSDELVINYNSNDNWQLAVLKNIDNYEQPDWIITDIFYDIPLINKYVAQNPAFIDLDNDGDFDLLIAEGDYYEPGNNRLRYFENIGTSTDILWRENSTVVKEINALKASYAFWTSPVWVDLDEDNKPDLILIEWQLDITFLKGFSLAIDSFGYHWQKIDLKDYGLAFFVSQLSELDFFDLNGDNHQDFISLFNGRGLRVYEHSGSAMPPYFINEYYRLGGMKMLSRSAPLLYNHNNDGHLDLIFTGNEKWFDEESAPGPESYTRIQITENKWQWLATNWCDTDRIRTDLMNTHFSLVDFTGDGILDVLVGGRVYDLLYTCNIFIWPNIGSNSQFNLSQYYYIDGTFSDGDILYRDPSFSDFNGDSNPDLLIQANEDHWHKSYGKYQFFTFAGTLENPIWIPRSEWSVGLDDSLASYAHIFDIDEDGDQDLIFGRTDGKLSCFINIHDSLPPIWQRADSIFEGIDVGEFSAPALGDMDNDGDFDLVVGNSNGLLFYFRNDTKVEVPQVFLDSITPDNYFLYQNYPNPFNRKTTIRYQLPESAHVTIYIYNLLGQYIRKLVDMNRSAGNHVVYWNGKDQFKVDVPSGVYFYKIIANEFIEAKEMIIIH